MWMAAGASNFPRSWFLSIFSISILISAAIIIAATRIPFGKNRGEFNGAVYGIVVSLEAIAILIAVILLNRSGRKEFVMPVIGTIVGVHFFGMVPATHSNEFWWIGGAMSALSLLTMFVLARKFWTPTIGLGCALILWTSAICAFF